MNRFRMYLVSALPFLVTPALPARAADPSPAIAWQSMSLPFEAGRYNLQVVWLYNPYSKSIFVGEDKKGLFKSQDGGKSWIRVDDGSFQAESTNNHFDSLQCGKDALYSIVENRNGTRIFVSADGKAWRPAWPRSPGESGEELGSGDRLWTDRKNPGRMYAQTVRYGYESAEVARQLWVTDNAWQSFREVPTADAWFVGSTDIHDGTICFEAREQISCSADGGATWGSVSLAPIADSIAKDKDVNSRPIIHIDTTNGELLIQSAGRLFQTRNGRSAIEEKVRVKGGLGDLVFHPTDTYPIYGILTEGDDRPWKIARIQASGSVDIFPGPKEKGFRLKSVDFSNSTLFIWASNETFRGMVR